MSLSLAENVIVVRANNHPPMLDKTSYSFWASRMLLYIKGKEYDKLLVDSVLNGPFQYKTIVGPGNETTPAMIRARTHTDLKDEEKIRESVYIKATNIVLKGLPHDIYNLVNHNEDAKQSWDRVKLLIQAFLVDNEDTVILAQASTEIPSPTAFQTGDLDAFDSDCDGVPSAKAILMANLFSYDSDVLLDVPFHDTNIENDMIYQNAKYFEIEKKELNFDNDHLLENIICQDVTHANDHSDNVLPANNNSFEHDNSALDMLKHENNRLMELLISQDLVHTVVNSLATINDYKTMQHSFMDEYNEILVLKAELAKKHDMIEKTILNTHKNADILREIIEHARELRLLDSDLDSASYYLEYLRELWYSDEVDAATNTTTFILSCSEKPLSFDLGDFSTINGLKYKNYEALLPKETVRAGLATLGLVDEKNP
nr:hypothetical protein [Tanacetum cinerariifolium]